MSQFEEKTKELLNEIDDFFIEFDAGNISYSNSGDYMLKLLEKARELLAESMD